MNLTQRIVHELLLYDPFTGSLTWRARKRKWFKSDKGWKEFNKRYAGQPALNVSSKLGYKRGFICGHHFLAHRVIWLWMTGRWPNPEVDHKNRNGADNRWKNLREATHAENMRNKSMSVRNKSGYASVRQVPSGRFRASMFKKSLGTFDTFEEAVAARKRAERRYRFSRGHGRRPPERIARRA